MRQIGKGVDTNALRRVGVTFQEKLQQCSRGGSIIRAGFGVRFSEAEPAFIFALDATRAERCDTLRAKRADAKRLYETSRSYSLTDLQFIFP